MKTLIKLQLVVLFLNVSTETKYAVMAIALAYVSLGLATRHSINTRMMISRTNEKIDGLDKKLDGLLGKSKKK